MIYVQRAGSDWRSYHTAYFACLAACLADIGHEELTRSWDLLCVFRCVACSPCVVGVVLSYTGASLFWLGPNQALSVWPLLCSGNILCFVVFLTRHRCGSKENLLPVRIMHARRSATMIALLVVLLLPNSPTHPGVSLWILVCVAPSSRTSGSFRTPTRRRTCYCRATSAGRRCPQT